MGPEDRDGHQEFFRTAQQLMMHEEDYLQKTSFGYASQRA